MCDASEPVGDAFAARPFKPMSAGAPPASTDQSLDRELLLAVEQGVALATGVSFFRELCRHLARALGVRWAAVTEFVPDRKSVRTLAFWDRDRFWENFEYPIAHTPCERVIDGAFCHYASAVAAAFPEHPELVQLGIESYMGVPLLDSRDRCLGHLYIMDDRAMPPEPRNLSAFRIFAARAAAELSRASLERAFAESERRFRDLFDEAPIAYVHEGMDSRFIRANRAAMRTLGIRPDQVEGTYGKSFVPDTPDAQRRLREAFDSIGRGTDTGGVVLELRRKDNGNPVWIQWWSNPDPSGAFTRTMFLDITDRVMMEREQERLRAANRHLSEEVKAVHNFGEIVGRSPSLIRVLEHVEQVAPTDSTVLIEGETGTGKELIARAIHERSARRDGPFIKVNCAALPASLVESEFFGHEKGAFTGAVAQRRGRFELADTGTIFLDEVGEVSPEVQVKILRVLQEREFERVGGSRTISVDVRIIAATNRDLASDVTAGTFRADLYYRLCVFPITVPALREREADIPALALHFARGVATQQGKRVDSIDPQTAERLVRYPWPGNIRELRNVVERAIILTRGTTLIIDEATLRPPGSQATQCPSGATPGSDTTATRTSAPRTLEAVERDHILTVLDQTRWAIAGPSGAASVLGLPPSTLRSRMQKLGIRREEPTA